MSEGGWTRVGPFALLLDHLGIVVFTGISVALIVYLIYTMLHPEAF